MGASPQKKSNMKKQKIHLVGSGLLALMLVGAFASGVGSNAEFFKGDAPLRVSQTSILMENIAADETDAGEVINIAEIKKANAERISLLNEIPAPVQEPIVEPVIDAAPPAPLPVLQEEPKSPPPVFTIVSEPAPQISAPAPVILPVVVESVATPAPVKKAETCEEKGKFTYTGPDRPKLIYGMCISCTTKEYILGNGSCPK